MNILLQSDAVAEFKSLREELLSACLKCIYNNEPFTVRCDASNFAITAVLSQGERPVDFMSRIRYYPDVNVTTTQLKTKLLRSKLCESGVTIYKVARLH